MPEANSQELTRKNNDKTSDINNIDNQVKDYELLVNIEGSENILSEVQFDISDSPLTFKVVPPDSKMPPPESMKVMYNDVGTIISLTFSQYTNRAGYDLVVLFDCSQLLYFEPSLDKELYNCVWMTDTTLQISRKLKIM